MPNWQLETTHDSKAGSIYSHLSYKIRQSWLRHKSNNYLGCTCRPSIGFPTNLVETGNWPTSHPRDSKRHHAESSIRGQPWVPALDSHTRTLTVNVQRIKYRVYTIRQDTLKRIIGFLPVRLVSAWSRRTLRHSRHGPYLQSRDYFRHLKFH